MPTKIRVMLVDDASVVRSMVQRALTADPMIEVVATAVDGQMALDFSARLKPDVIILDIEMPVMDGITALPELLKRSPSSRIIMASTLTLRNADISMQAMRLGASDYLAKPSASSGNEVEEFFQNLIMKVKALAPSSLRVPMPTVPAAKPGTAMGGMPVPPLTGIVRPQPNPTSCAALAIASSTGGPQALINIFSHFASRKLRVPIFITQHMPATFTTILATHISKEMGGDCHEAKDGEQVAPGVVYVAPGDYHMTAVRDGTQVKLKLDQNPQENFCRPAADPMLRSLAKIYGSQLLVAVLTGIGADGMRGAVDVVNAGGTVIAQDAASSVVYGMPRAVAEANLLSAVLPLPQIGPYLLKAVS